MPNENNNIQSVSGESNIILYTSEDGKINLEVQVESETVWLTQQQIAQLYGKAVSTINEHLKNIFAEKELNEDTCVKKFGNSEFQQKVPFSYNLDTILAVGFRVRSKQGTLFRHPQARRSKYQADPETHRHRTKHHPACMSRRTCGTGSPAASPTPSQAKRKTKKIANFKVTGNASAIIITKQSII